jgi:hypothetical protein
MGVQEPRDARLEGIEDAARPQQLRRMCGIAVACGSLSISLDSLSGALVEAAGM